MAEPVQGAPQGIDRRGMDAAVIALIKQLHEDFVDSHGHVHETFVDAHTREHELTDAAHERALVEMSRLDQERDRRYEERHLASQRAVDAALVSVQEAIHAAFASSEKAITVAAAAIEKRADATYVQVGQLQGSLGDLMPKGEADQRFRAVESGLADLRGMMASANAELRDRVKGLESLKQGGREALSTVQVLMGIIVAVLVIAAAIIGTK